MVKLIKKEVKPKRHFTFHKKQCEYCGGAFTSRIVTAKYCCNSHRVMAFRKAKANKNKLKKKIRITKKMVYMLLCFWYLIFPDVK